MSGEDALWTRQSLTGKTKGLGGGGWGSGGGGDLGGQMSMDATHTVENEPYPASHKASLRPSLPGSGLYRDPALPDTRYEFL